MGLRGIEMGSTPPMIPGRIGLVGFPVWLWAADPGPQTWGPVSGVGVGGRRVCGDRDREGHAGGVGDGQWRCRVLRRPGRAVD